MNKLKSWYPLKVWLTTLVIGPPLFLGTLFLNGKGTADMAGAFWVILLVSAVLSLPAFLINIFVCRRIAAGSLEALPAQAAVAGTGIGFIAITFLIIAFMADYSRADFFDLYMPASYMVGSVIAAFCFQLRTDATVFPSG
jgi:hypothetical protein